MRIGKLIAGICCTSKLEYSFDPDKDVQTCLLLHRILGDDEAYALSREIEPREPS